MYAVVFSWGVRLKFVPIKLDFACATEDGDECESAIPIPFASVDDQTSSTRFDPSLFVF